MIKTQDFTIFASASAWVTMIICMHRRVKSACNDGAEKQSLGVWAVLCTAAMYHVNAIIIQLCSREELSYHTFVLYRAAKLQQFVSLLPIDESIQMLVPQLGPLLV